MMRNEITVDLEKSVFSQALSVIIFGSRADRLNEWQMDEIADKAADLEKEIKSQAEEIKALKAVNLKYIAALSSISNGYDDEEEGSLHYYPAYSIAMDALDLGGSDGK